MKKIINKTFLVLCLAVAMVFGMGALGSQAYAATVGQQLLQPEEGWQRFDDSNKFIYYEGKWDNRDDMPDQYFYDGTYSMPCDLNNKAIIKFKGTKIRIIASILNDYDLYGACEDLEVKVDNGPSERVSCWGPSIINEALIYDKDGLDNDLHIVTITNASEGAVKLDAIDIDKDGKLINADPAVDNNRGILTINMKNAKTCSYDLTMDEINNFITWYENRSEGQGESSYLIGTDCLSFDNITDFSVGTY